MKLKRPSLAACSITSAAILLVATTIFAQQLGNPTADDATTAQHVCKLISRYHISHGKIDDAVSRKLFDRFIDTLDPQKQYFVAADVEKFKANRDQLDDQLTAGQVQFAYDVFRTYIQRANERIEFAHKMIDIDHDFNLDETMVIDAEDIPFSASLAEQNDRWRRRVKYEILNLTLANETRTGDDEKEDLTKIRERLHKRYNTVLRSVNETESSEVLEIYLSSLTHCFDPHSSYMSEETWQEFQIQMRLSLDGIGAALRSEDGDTYVASIVKGGAASKDGRLEVGDKITAVAQETGDFEDIIEMKLSKVVRLIRGPRGSKVRLQVLKAESGDTVIYDLIRQKIELKESEVKGEIIETTDRVGRRGRIGVINIPSFYRDFDGAEKGLEDFASTARDLQKVLVKFRREGGVDAIVIDLRNNGGGALSEAIEVSGLFINEGPVVQVKEPGSRVKTYSDDIEGAFSEPLIVVCNRMSASASEIFAGAIKDYRRGIVVGDQTTHGKGTVQNLMPVSAEMFRFFARKEHGRLKLTINQFYRVNGDSTQNEGVKSDVVLPSLLDHMDVGESSLDNALAFDRIAPSEFEKVAYVNSEAITRLKTMSAERVAASKDFREVQEDIQKYLERKNRKEITLNAAKLRAERDADRREDKEDKKDDDNDDDDPPVFAETPYNAELLNIALDYVEVLQQARTAQR
jgi:carboxyl-terminal processing protease